MYSNREDFLAVCDFVSRATVVARASVICKTEVSRNHWIDPGQILWAAPY